MLPFLSIFLIVVGGQAIGMRSMCIYELGTDYVKYAKLLGIDESKILLYMFRNAMLPQLTGLALALGAMVGGALITEMIFSYPGLGMAVLTAIQGNDYPVITGCTLLVTVTVLIANFSVDVLIGLPRSAHPRRAGRRQVAMKLLRGLLKSPAFLVGIGALRRRSSWRSWRRFSCTSTRTRASGCRSCLLRASTGSAPTTWAVDMVVAPRRRACARRSSSGFVAGIVATVARHARSASTAATRAGCSTTS